MRIGGSKPVADIRVIASTNKDLREEIKGDDSGGSFLSAQRGPYRAEIRVGAQGGHPLLAEEFCRAYSKKNMESPFSLSPGWDGSVDRVPPPRQHPGSLKI